MGFARVLTPRENSLKVNDMLEDGQDGTRPVRPKN